MAGIALHPSLHCHALRREFWVSHIGMLPSAQLNRSAIPCSEPACCGIPSGRTVPALVANSYRCSWHLCISCNVCMRTWFEFSFEGSSLVLSVASVRPWRSVQEFGQRCCQFLVLFEWRNMCSNRFFLSCWGKLVCHQTWGRKSCFRALRACSSRVPKRGLEPTGFQPTHGDDTDR